MWVIQIDDDLTTSKLSIVEIGGKIVNVSFTVQPLQDPLVKRCIEKLGEFGETVLLMSGATFKNETNLRYQLNEVWLNYVETSEEDEIGDLLDEVQERALAAREALEFDRIHGVSLPTQEKLKETIRLLSVLQ